MVTPTPARQPSARRERDRQQPRHGQAGLVDGCNGRRRTQFQRLEVGDPGDRGSEPGQRQVQPGMPVELGPDGLVLAGEEHHADREDQHDRRAHGIGQVRGDAFEPDLCKDGGGAGGERRDDRQDLPGHIADLDQQEHCHHPCRHLDRRCGPEHGRLPPRVAQRAPRHPQLAGRCRADVAIVGGGITGAIAALRFAEAGVDAVVLEADRIAHGSTAASSALLLQEPDARLSALSERYGTATARRIWRLSHDAAQDLIALIERLSTPAALARRDTIYFTTDADEVAPLHREYVGAVPGRLRRDVADAAGAAGRGGHPGPRRHPDARRRALRSRPRLRGRDARGGARRRAGVRAVARCGGSSRGAAGRGAGPHRGRCRRGAAGGDRDRLRDAPVPTARPAASDCRAPTWRRRRRSMRGRGASSASPTSCCGTRAGSITTRAGPPTIACCSAAPIGRSAAAAGRRRRACRRGLPRSAPIRGAAAGARRRRVSHALGGPFREHAGQPALHRPAPPVSGPRVRARLRRQRHDVRLARRPPAGRAVAGRQSKDHALFTFAR